MKKLPVIIVSVGCIITALIVSMTPTVKVVNNTTYSYFNYELLGTGFAINISIVSFVIFSFGFSSLGHPI